MRLTLNEARKAQVLGSNTDVATKFGADLQNFSKELRLGLKKLYSTQDKLGKQLHNVLNSYTQRGQEV